LTHTNPRFTELNLQKIKLHKDSGLYFVTKQPLTTKPILSYCKSLSIVYLSFRIIIYFVNINENNMKEYLCN